MGRRYPHLNLEERRKIAQWLNARMPIPEMADRLGRAPSTICRELKRNCHDDEELPELNGYHAVNAQGMYERRRAIHRKLFVHPQVKAAVEDRLRAGWSPEQSCPRRAIGSRDDGNGRMRLGHHPVRVSHDDLPVRLLQGWPSRGILPASPGTPQTAQTPRLPTASSNPCL